MAAAYGLLAIVLNMVMDDFRVSKGGESIVSSFFVSRHRSGWWPTVSFVLFQSCKEARIIFQVLRALSSLVLWVIGTRLKRHMSHNLTTRF